MNIFKRLLRFLGFGRKFKSGDGVFTVPKGIETVIVEFYGAGGGGSGYSLQNKESVVKETELPIGNGDGKIKLGKSSKLEGSYDPLVSLYDLEKDYVLKALDFFGGNKTKAANALGITIKTLYNKLHEYGEFEKYAVHSKLTKRHIYD